MIYFLQGVSGGEGEGDLEMICHPDRDEGNRMISGMTTLMGRPKGKGSREKVIPEKLRAYEYNVTSEYCLVTELLHWAANIDQ